jgi:ATP-dependent DNA helicase RecG
LVERLIGVKEARARRILKDMTDKGLIEKRGSGRSTYYVRAEG